MQGFVGRQAELDRLRGLLDSVAAGGEGILLSVRGRRQVGKSRLIEELLRRTAVPSVFFTAAARRPIAEEVESFATEVAASSLEAAPFLSETRFPTWEPALRLLASHVTVPSVVVVDELPFLIQQDPSLEGALQRVWDRYLSRVPILMIAVGSDLSMMEALGRYDRPLYQRMRELVVEPLSPAETTAMLRLSPADGLDAHLVHGGFPTLARTWSGQSDVSQFLAGQLSDATSPLVVVGERVLNVEFPPDMQARAVLEVIGGGETTFGGIGDRSGINQGSLTRTLDTLVNDKRVVAVDRPLSGRRSRNAFYRIADPYLRFWLRFLGPGLELVYRGRGEVLAEQIMQQWSTYRGRAIEPVIRASIDRMLPDERFGEARYTGAYWSRTADVEMDLVGGRKPVAPTAISFVGSIKWRERSPFSRRDLTTLAAAQSQVPGAADARLVGVSRAGFTTGELDAALGPADLLAAWEPGRVGWVWSHTGG